MLNAFPLPPELEFIDAIVRGRGDQYITASWLACSFSDEYWYLKFGDGISITVDFRVSLENGTLLTSHGNHILLEIFKRWLCIQDHPDTSKGRLLSAKASRDRVVRTLHLIDYFLLNAESFKLSTFGLTAITENDLTRLLMDLGSSSSVTTSIYQWPNRLAAFLRCKLATLSSLEFDAIVERHPFIAEEIPAPEDRMLGLSDQEIVLSRAWLWANKFYKGTTPVDYRYSPSTERLAKQIYANSLRGQTAKPVPDELLLDPLERYTREFPHLAVKDTQDDRLLDKKLQNYKAQLQSVSLLADTGLPVPTAVLSELDNQALIQSLNIKEAGRFRLLPPHVVFGCLRSSIEFALEYGNDLIDSYLSVVRAAQAAGLSCYKYSAKHSIKTLLPAKIRDLGVQRWTINNELSSVKKDLGRATRTRYFERLRRNEGLWELLRVLYGSVYVCLGTLSARRVGELMDLVVGKCLDPSETRLLFFNRKSGSQGLRQVEVRPIPAIAVRLIKMLERLQYSLVSEGILDQVCPLFCYPSQFGEHNRLVTTSSRTLYISADYFCDYFQTPITAEGARYYLRQHPLRRFFPMLFFWGNSFGGMDTLRWFLGHTEVEHIYRYITEVTPGDVMRRFKVSYAAEQLKIRSTTVEPLAALVQSHFGTGNFSILADEELEQYIEELIVDGTCDVEPQFINTDKGESYRILVTVKSRGPLR